MTWFGAVCAGVALMIGIGGAQRLASPPKYHRLTEISIDSGIGDFLALDPVGRRLYGAGDMVIDIDNNTVVGSLPPHTGHGFAIDPSLGKGMGRRGIIFDLHTYAAKGRLPVNGDATAYDPTTHLAFFLHKQTAVVDLQRDSLIATIDFTGAERAGVQSGVMDGRGHMYVNVITRPDTNRPIVTSVAVVDVHTLQATARWVIEPCFSGKAIAMDSTHHRLFIGCDNKVVVVNSDNGAVVNTIPVNGLADMFAFDPTYNVLLHPDGDGVLTVIQEDTPDSFHVADTVRTGGGGVLALDQVTHRVFMFETSGKHMTVVVVAP
jgi:hypothetical protein